MTPDQAQMIADQDQEWAKGIAWLRQTSGSLVLWLMKELSKDDSVAALRKIADMDPMLADVVCRMADLALKELWIRLLDQTAQDQT